MKMRTMRDVPTIQGLRNHATPTTREQAITELARLEHELARLQREMNMWIANQNKTAERMHQVEQRLAFLREILEPQRVEDAPERRADRSETSKADASEQEKTQGWRTVNLQY